MAFHEVRFPAGISRGSSGGPERRTQIVAFGGGWEERNQQWANSRRRYNAGYGVRSLADIHAVIAFFEERRGRLHGFRWKDWSDCKSTAPEAAAAATDQALGLGDGATTQFQLIKTYGADFAPWTRTIAKPATGTVRVTVDGVEQEEGTGFTVDATTGIVTFAAPPASGLAVTAGFEFDVPVRFDTDHLDVNLQLFGAGQVPSIPIVELRL